jgi:hypothetical protein
MSSHIEKIIHVNQSILDRRTRDRGIGIDDTDTKVYVGDLKQGNMEQLGCDHGDHGDHGVTPPCEGVMKQYNMAYNDMIDAHCTRHGYVLNEKGTKLVKVY